MLLALLPVAYAVFVLVRSAWRSREHRQKIEKFEERFAYLKDKRDRKQIFSRQESNEWHEIGEFVAFGGELPDFRRRGR